MVEQFNWKIICGLPKTSKVVQNILLETSIPTTPQYKIKNSECGHIYAKKIRARVFGKVRSVIVYSNMNAGIRDTEERNDVLQSYSHSLNQILKNEENQNKKKLNDHLIKLLKSYYRFFAFRFKKIDGHITGEWKFND